MLHLSFAFYLLSLFSGLSLLVSLTANKKYSQTPAFIDFIQLNLLIMALVTVTTACLYLSVNLSSLEWVGQCYLSAILLFLGCLPWLMTKQHYRAAGLALTRQYVWILQSLLIYGITAALAIWQLPEDAHVWLLLVAIVALVCVLLHNNILVTKSERVLSTEHTSHYLPVNKTKIKKLTWLMHGQSLLLTLTEVVFFSEQLALRGITLSLPLLYLINNSIIWFYRDELLLNNQRRYSVDVTSITTDKAELATTSVSLNTELLSPKELEVALSVIQGLSNKEIAAIMTISPSTVKNHLYNIYKKYQVTNRVALIHSLQKPPTC